MVIKKIILLLFVTFGLNLIILAQKKITKLEKLIDKAYSIIEGDSSSPRKSYFVAIPIWGIYPETGWRIGLSNNYFFRTNMDSITRPSFIRLNFQYTQYKQYSIRPIIDIYTKNNLYNYKLLFNFTDFNEYYYGIGNNTQKQNRELYNFRLNQLDLRATKQIIPNLFFGVQGHLEKMYNMRYSNNSILNKPNVPGGQGSYASGLGLVFAFDNRDKIYFPLNGAYVELSNMYYSSTLGSNFNFNTITIDARKFKHLKKFNVLAFQVYSKLNFGQAPFRLLPTIGNDMIMRGYYNGRFRDNLMYAAQTELRHTIWGPIGFTLFAGFGNVGKNTSDLLGSVKPNYGIGLRGLALRKDHINIRIDYGRGQNGINGLYFTMGEAF